MGDRLSKSSGWRRWKRVNVVQRDETVDVIQIIESKDQPGYQSDLNGHTAQAEVGWRAVRLSWDVGGIWIPSAVKWQHDEQTSCPEQRVNGES